MAQTLPLGQQPVTEDLMLQVVSFSVSAMLALQLNREVDREKIEDRSGKEDLQRGSNPPHSKSRPPRRTYRRST